MTLLLTIINIEDGETIEQFWPDLSTIVDLDNDNREYVLVAKDELQGFDLADVISNGVRVTRVAELFKADAPLSEIFKAAEPRVPE